MLIDFMLVNPVARPAQQFGPVVLSHPAECTQRSLKSKSRMKSGPVQIPAQNRKCNGHYVSDQIGKLCIVLGDSSHAAWADYYNADTFRDSIPRWNVSLCISFQFRTDTVCHHANRWHGAD